MNKAGDIPRDLNILERSQQLLFTNGVYMLIDVYERSIGAASSAFATSPGTSQRDKLN